MRKIRYTDFDILRPIGTGTVGTIFHVRRRSDGQELALKLLAPFVCSDKLVVARFEREMLVLSKLNHPNIVSYFGQGTHRGQLFYVMELMQGGTLKTVLEKTGPLDWQETADCGCQLASALQHSHNFGIIHRDLKPSNVYITRSGILKLGDFGIARDLRSQELTDTGLTVGTYAYMPPELVRGERNITGKVDLYAMGCVLFEMLTGVTPFRGDNFAEIFEQHLQCPPPHVESLVPNLPQAMDQLIDELLAKDPENRPFNARVVQGRLGELVDLHTVSTETDKGAATVRLGQAALMQRMESAQQAPQIGWRAILTTVLVLALIVWLIRVVGS